MSGDRAAVLPYRTEAEDLVRVLEARARGRSFAQVRALGFSAKTFEGTVQAAQALAFLRRDGEELTERGRRFALASPDERQELLREAMMGYEPYGLLLEAIFAREAPAATEIAWIERWWATHGYGSSESNRAEAAAVFGRLVEHLGMGAYVPGRRGHPTRIDWRGEAQEAVAARFSAATAPQPTQEETLAAPAPPPEPEGESAMSSAAAEAAAVLSGYSTATIEVRGGVVAQISVPSPLTRAERERLMALLDLLIRVRPGE